MDSIVEHIAQDGTIVAVLGDARKRYSKLKVVQLLDAYCDGILERAAEQEECSCIF